MEALLGSTSRGYELHICHRDSLIEVELIEGKPLIIGRASDADISIDDGNLSKQHARFELIDGKARVSDLGSTNGMWIGANKVNEGVLSPTERVLIGNVVVAFQARGTWDRGLRRVTGHEPFRTLVEDEVVRAKQFGRNFSLLLIHASSAHLLSAYAAAALVVESLEPAEKLALYSGDTLEVLLPEVSAQQVSERVATFLRKGDAYGANLRIGVATYPTAGTNLEALFQVAHDALRGATAVEPIKHAGSPLSPSPSAGRPPATDFVFRSPVIKNFLKDVDRVAKTRNSVILFGETGVGKEVMARRLHDKSPRRKKPFLALNCGALPKELVEATLFGHERGAFTSAVARRDGYFQAAEGGTLFLDEIGELPAPAQVALLRVLDLKRITRVGDTAETPVDVRVLAATHRDLEGMVARGEFRSDLFYRLSPVTLTIPPLRDREDDIGPLAQKFLEDAVAESAQENEGGPSDFASSVRAIAPRAMALLTRYSWPGNIRELRNVIVRAVALSRSSTLTFSDLPDRIQKLSVKKEVVHLGSAERESEPAPQLLVEPESFNEPAGPVLLDSGEEEGPSLFSGPHVEGEEDREVEEGNRENDGRGEEEGGQGNEGSEENEGEDHGGDTPQKKGQPKLFPAELVEGGPSYRELIFAYDKALVTDALRKTRGNRMAAAKLLDISIRTMIRKINELGIKKNDY